MTSLKFPSAAVRYPTVGGGPLPAMEKVSYGAGSHEYFNVYPGSSSGATTIMLVHGGAWVAQLGVKTVAEALQTSGFAVFDTQYELAKAGGPAAFPLQVANLEAAAAYAKAHAGTYKASATSRFWLGGSSGANITAVAALKAILAGDLTFKAVITLSGAHDLRRLVEEAAEGKLTNGTYTKSLPIALGTDTDAHALEEPYRALADANSATKIATGANKPPRWLTYNSSKELMPLTQQTGLVAALEAVGCPVTARVPTSGQHSFNYWNTVAAGSSLTVGQQVIEFIREHA